MKTKFIPIDYDYFDFKGRNYIKIIGRDDNQKRICIIDTCKVYLWAILEENLKKDQIEKIIDKIKKIKIELKGRTTKIDSVELHEKNFMGRKVKALKIFATNYKDLHDVADKLDIKEITNRRGYDLGYITHYIIEKQIKPLNWYEISGEVLNNSLEFGGIDMGLDVDICIKLETSKEIKDQQFNPKILAYDIETDELQIGKGEILMISLVSENFKKVITWKKPQNLQKHRDITGGSEKCHRSELRGSSKETSGCLLESIEFVKDEAELIEKFIEHVRKISPDFLVGYYSDGFDLPYIQARAEKHKVKLALGLDDSQPRFSRGIELTGKIKGITHIDILKFIRTAYAQYMKSETLSLNEVAKEFLQDTKIDFELKHSSKIEDHNWEKYYEYNLQDSILTLKLFEKFWPDLLEELFNKRKQYKAEYKKNKNPITLARSNAFKVLSASAHGYLGFFGARYYSIEYSATVLAYVRKFNIETIEKTEKKGYQVIYGDTDSIAFLMNGKTKEEINELLQYLNDELPGVMHLELEGFFKRGLWVTTRKGITGAKKKYALLDEENNLKIRGFETVRRDWCKLSREIQNKIIRQILKDGNEIKALEYVKELVKKIKERKIDKKDLMIRTQLKKPISEYKAISPHVIAAKKMKEQEIPVTQGDLIEYYIAETETKKKLVREKVKLPNEKGEYNIEYYLEKQILPAVENIFQVFKINIKEIIDGKKQDNLNKWF